MMTSDETQIQISGDWPVSHAKCVTKDNRKSRILYLCRDKETADRQKLSHRKSWPNQMLPIFNIGLVMIFLRDSFCLSAVSLSRQRHDMLCIFLVVLCHAFCMWHWPIGKDLDLSFIWGHHRLHLVGMDNQSTSYILHYLPHCAEETQQGRNSCPWLQFLAFSLDSIMSLSR